MRNAIFVILLFLLITPNHAAAGGQLVIASVPWRNAEILKDLYKPLVSLLEEKLSVSVALLVTDDYHELGERLHRGVADIGIFGGNSYVVSRAQYPGLTYLATCKQPTDRYYSFIIVHRSSGITQLKELKGKSFSFTDKGSTSGYIYPQLILRAGGINVPSDFQRVYFLKKHDKVYDAVAHRSIAAGGVSSTALAKAVQRNGDVFKIIGKSDPIPRNPVVAGAHLDRAMVDRIQNVLKHAENSPHFQNSNSILKGFSIKDDSFYDIIREARKLQQ